MSNILDSGSRREFETGAVRDIQEGKGRCDLLPIDVVAPLMDTRQAATVLAEVGEYMCTGRDMHLYLAIRAFCELVEWDTSTCLLEVSVHYEQGATKYGERNWEKGIPVHAYIDSGVRHLFKHLRGDNDERHDRAFVWNMLGAIWTSKHFSNLEDIPYNLLGHVYSSNLKKQSCDANNQDVESAAVEETAHIEGEGRSSDDDDDVVCVDRKALNEMVDAVSEILNAAPTAPPAK